MWSIPLAVIGLMLVRGICSFFSDYLLAWVANNMLLGIRREMFERLLGLYDAEFKRGETGRLLNRITIDAGNVTSSATSVITVDVRAHLLVVGLMCAMLVTDWQSKLLNYRH